MEQRSPSFDSVVGSPRTASVVVQNNHSLVSSASAEGKAKSMLPVVSTLSFGFAVTKLLEHVGIHRAIATGDHVKVKNAPYQDLVLEWVVTPHLPDWHYPGAMPALGTMLSMAHYIDHESGDRYADLEVVFRKHGGVIRPEYDTSGRGVAFEREGRRGGPAPGRAGVTDRHPLDISFTKAQH